MVISGTTKVPCSTTVSSEGFGDMVVEKREDRGPRNDSTGLKKERGPV